MVKFIEAGANTKDCPRCPESESPPRPVVQLRPAVEEVQLAFIKPRRRARGQKPCVVSSVPVPIRLRGSVPSRARPVLHCVPRAAHGARTHSEPTCVAQRGLVKF